MPGHNGALIGIAVTMIGMTNGYAVASPFTVSLVDNATSVEIKGAPNEMFKVLYLSANGTLGQTSVTTDAAGTATVGPVVKASKTAEVQNMSEPTQPVQSVSVFSPGSTNVVSTYALAAGSSLTFGTSVFALSGGYTTVDTIVDYDPSSPTYGTETGFLGGLNIAASGTAGTVTFDLASEPAYSVNLASIWGEQIPPAGLSVPIDVTFSGTLSFASSSSPFTGTFVGTDTFLSDGSTIDQGTISFDNDFGLFTGNLTASALPVVEPVPEPSSASLFMTAIGAITLLGACGAGRIKG
jgi:hypothetical protein